MTILSAAATAEATAAAAARVTARGDSWSRGRTETRLTPASDMVKEAWGKRVRTPFLQKHGAWPTELDTSPTTSRFPLESTAAPLAYPEELPAPVGRRLSDPCFQMHGSSLDAEAPTTPDVTRFPEPSTATPVAHPVALPAPTGRTVREPFSQTQGSTALLALPTTPEMYTFP